MVGVDRDQAMARRAEIRATVAHLYQVDDEGGWDDDSPNVQGSYADEMDMVNEIVGIKDCDQCGRDYDANYPDDYCPMCVAEMNSSRWDWQPMSPSNGLFLPDIKDEEGQWVGWCKSGLGEMRCLYPEGHGGPHRFTVEWD